MAEERTTVASVGVKVVPDASGWDKDAQRQLAPQAQALGEELGKIVGNEIQKQISSSLTAGVRNSDTRQAAIQKGAQTGKSFGDSLKASLKAALTDLPKVEIDADSSEADRAIDEIRQRLQSLASKRLDIDISTAEARAEVDQIQAKLKELGRDHPDIGVQVDTAAAEADLARFSAMVDKIDSRNAQLRVEAQTEAAVQALREVGIEAEAVAGESPTVRVDADVAGAEHRLAEVGLEAQVLARESPTIRVDADTSGAERGLLGIGSAAEGGMTHVQGLIAIGMGLAPVFAAAGAAATGALAAIGAAAGAVGAAIGVAVLALKPVLDAYQAIQGAKTAASTTSGGDTSGRQNAMVAANSQLQQSEMALANTRANVADQARTAAEAVVNAKRSEAQAEMDASRSIQDAEQAVARARQSAADQTKAAKQSLAQAEQSAAQSNSQALAQEQAAEQNLASAQQTAREAQQSLNDARAQAAEQLKQLQFQAEDAALNQKQAGLDVEQAQANLDQTLRDPGSTGLQIAQARLALEQAKQRLKEQTEQAKELKKQNQDAQKAGVEGSDLVVAAKKAEIKANDQVIAQQKALVAAEKNVNQTRIKGAQDVAQAQDRLVKAERDGAQSVADAETNLARARVDAQDKILKAQQGVSDAQRSQATQARQGAFSIASAQKGVTDAQRSVQQAYKQTGTAAQSATDKARAAVAKLTPAGRDFLKFIMGIKGGFDELSGIAQEGFLPGLQRGLKAMAPLWTPVKKAVDGVAKAMGKLSEEGGKFLGGPAGQQFANFLANNLGPWLTSVGNMFGGFGKGMMGLFQSLGPTIKVFLGYFEKMWDDFGKWGQNSGKDKGFQGFLDYVDRVGPKVFTLLGKMMVVFAKIMEGLAPLGAVIVEGLLAIFTGLSKLNGAQLLAVAFGIGAIMFALEAPLAPIILLVAGIGLLVIWFKKVYDSSADLRKNMSTLWTNIKTGFAGAWKIVGPIFSEMFTAINDNLVVAVKGLFALLAHIPSGVWKAAFLILLAPFALVAKAITLQMKGMQSLIKVFGSAAKWMSSTFKTAWSFVNAYIVDPIKRAFSTVKSLLGLKGMRAIFNDMANWAIRTWNKAWNGITYVFFHPIDAAKSAISKALGATGIRSSFLAVKDWVKGAWSRVWAGITYTMTHPIDAAKTAISKLLGVTGIRKIFSDCVTAIGKIWDKVGDKVSGPINFILGIFNWFAKQFNKIGKLVGFTIPDNLSVSAPKHSGGGQVASGGGHAVVSPYATGGRVQPLPSRRDGGPIPGPWRGETADNVLGIDYSGTPIAHVNPGEYITRVRSTENMQKQFPGYLEYINEHGRPPGFANGGVLFAGGPSGGSFPTSGFSDRWQWNRVKKQFPNAQVTSAYRPGAQTAGGYGASYHSIGRAIDIGGSASTRAAVAKWLLASYGRASHDLIYSGLWGNKSIYEGSPATVNKTTADMHRTHVHWGLRLGGGHSGGLLGDLKDWVGSGLSFLASKAFDPVKKLFNSKLSGLKQFASPFATEFIPNLGKKMLSSAISKALSFGSDDSSGVSVPANVTGSKALGQNMAKQMGWTGNQWSSLYKLWMGESGWNPEAYNASSGATGIPQALPGSKMAAAGPNWRHDAGTQIKWGLGYIKQVYGSPAAAYSKWLARHPHWYAGGGLVRGNNAAEQRMWSMIMQGDPDQDVNHGYATGTMNATPGIHPVAENGAEVVLSPQLRRFAGGETVVNPRDSLRAVLNGGSSGGDVVFNVEGVDANNVNEFSKEMLYQLRRVQRAGKYRSLTR